MKKLFSDYPIEKGSEVGKANGLTVLLDAETFDYTYHLKVKQVKYCFHNFKLV